MVGENFIDVVDVKNEFLRNVGSEYARNYPPQYLDVALFLLNDFCNNLVGNGLMLVKPISQPQQPRSFEPIGQPSYSPPGAYQPQPQMRPQMRVQSNPFDEAELRARQFDQQQVDGFDVQRSVDEMNAQLVQSQQQRVFPQQQFARSQYDNPQPQYVVSQPLTKQPIIQDVDLSADKPKSFVDKIREMRTPKKGDKINPEE